MFLETYIFKFQTLIWPKYPNHGQQTKDQAKIPKKSTTFFGHRGILVDNVCIVQWQCEALLDVYENTTQ